MGRPRSSGADRKLAAILVGSIPSAIHRRKRGEKTRSLPTAFDRRVFFARMHVEEITSASVLSSSSSSSKKPELVEIATVSIHGYPGIGVKIKR